MYINIPHPHVLLRNTKLNEIYRHCQGLLWVENSFNFFQMKDHKVALPNVKF